MRQRQRAAGAGRCFDAAPLFLALPHRSGSAKASFRISQAWARDYLQAIVQRDLRELAEVARLERTPRLLRALTSHAAQLVNFTQVGERLALGVVLYDGDVAVPFGERLWAAPMACLFGN